MLSLVASVAEMTGLRDRDEVGQSICGLLYDLIGPHELTFWHVLSVDGVPRALRTIHLGKGDGITSDSHHDCEDSMPVDSCPSLHACVSRKAVHVARDDFHGSDLFFPVLGKRGVLGVLEVRTNNAWNPGDTALVERLLQIYSNHLALLDYGELDGLTGLMNRKAFDDHFSQLIDEQRRLAAQRGVADVERTCWLALVDIDHFKSINDRFGHLLGDEVLALAARLMQRSFRRVDRLFRCGGEEFAIMLHDLTAEEAEQSLEQFRAGYAAFPFPQVEKVTASLGFTRVSLTDNLPTAFGRADRALYYSKQNGRNRVSCYDDLLAAGLLDEKNVVLNDVELF